MAKCYINGIGTIVAQDALLAADLYMPLTEHVTFAVQPDYKSLIAPNMIRRMARGVKMGIYAAQVALNEAEVTIPDAVITGTGLGCIEDSEKFLKTILDNDEQFLTPTSFIQSTHNTVGAQIALRLQCKGYNFTYVNRDSSFEMALLDGLLQVQQNEAKQVLIGGIDELSADTIKLLQIAEIIRSDKNTNAAVYSEGANFYVLSETQSEATYAEVLDVEIANSVSDLKAWIDTFLNRNNKTIAQIDAVVLGLNADFRNESSNSEILSFFPTQTILHYKHVIGQYDTASAFGFGLAAQLLKHQKVSKTFVYKDGNNQPKLVLVVNQNHEKDFSLVLIQR
ncbi:beta-ketoacyl synthase chain length factor [Flavobacterium agricola]|uniref:Beta-ketoacyl synthase chain length factor n=1 Tax=Flavobacterium agricola TaxID=2870839 RepID=A0ABY6LXC5_9FLAO|nr:beta-ketoacyl synthase chain length factor [Flavobacterium agricola]UYW00993.1 beta-ketoacyl synthase chain length factor [Flavobacterium agricola]